MCLKILTSFFVFTKTVRRRLYLIDKFHKHLKVNTIALMWLPPIKFKLLDTISYDRKDITYFWRITCTNESVYVSNLYSKIEWITIESTLYTYVSWFTSICYIHITIIVMRTSRTELLYNNLVAIYLNINYSNSCDGLINSLQVLLPKRMSVLSDLNLNILFQIVCYMWILNCPCKILESLSFLIIILNYYKITLKYLK
jgi:hypothetical protein